MANILQNRPPAYNRKRPEDRTKKGRKKQPPPLIIPATSTQRKSIRVIKSFNKLFKSNPGKRLFVIYGGAGSGKSYAVAQRLCKILCEEKGVSILSVRKTLPSLRVTSYKLIVETLEAWGIPYTHNKSERIITVGPNTIWFTGLDDPEKVKSAEFNYIWVEELTELDKKSFLQLNLRLRRPHPSRKNNQFYVTFNPIDSFHWVITDVIEGPPNPKIIIHHSTYLDNPFLDPVYVEELQKLEAQDPNYYRIYTLGLPGVLEGLIYKNYRIEAKPPAAGLWLRDSDALGLDFGFNNETALIAVRYFEGRFYLKQLLYVKGYTNTDLIKWMQGNLPNKNIPIYADAAEPARIEEIAREGFNIWPARKEVVPGIDFLQAQALILDPESPNLIEEFRNYKWRQDKEGRILDDPVKFRDHLADAARYAIYTMNIGEVPVSIEILRNKKSLPKLNGPRDQYKETGTLDLEDPDYWPEDFEEEEKIPGL